MKNTYKFFILSAFVFFSFFVSSSVFAVEDTTSKNVLVAGVSIQNAKVVFNDGQTFKISFSLANKKGIQTGVKYGIKLLSGANNDKIIDEKVYDESLTLQENSSVDKQITYTAPNNLSGDYSLFLTSNNTSGFPFGVASLGAVNVKSPSQGVEIVNSSCYLKTDKKDTHYGLLDGVQVSKDSAFSLTCNAINHTNSSVSSVPTFETRYRSLYGDIAQVSGGDVSPITFKALEKGSFTIALPKGTSAQMYNLKVSFGGTGKSSNAVSVHYRIAGTSASIQNLSLDKSYYSGGDTAKLSIVWTKSSDAKVSLSASMTDSEGKECTQAINNQAITKDPANPKTEIPLSITEKCSNPHISLTLSDDKGNTLDKKEFSFESKKDDNGSFANMAAIALIVLLVIIIVAIYMKKKKNNMGGNINVLIPFFMLIALAGIMTPNKASADTYQNGDILTTVDLDSSTYIPGGAIKIKNISITSSAGDTLSVKLTYTNEDGSPDPVANTLISTQDIDPGYSLLHSDVVLTSPYGAPNAIGSYQMTFVTGVNAAGTPPPGGSCPYYVTAEPDSFRHVKIKLWQGYATPTGATPATPNYTGTLYSGAFDSLHTTTFDTQGCLNIYTNYTPEGVAIMPPVTELCTPSPSVPGSPYSWSWGPNYFDVFLHSNPGIAGFGVWGLDGFRFTGPVTVKLNSSGTQTITVPASCTSGYYQY